MSEEKQLDVETVEEETEAQRAIREGVRPWSEHDIESWCTGFICSAGYPFVVRVNEVDMSEVETDDPEMDHLMVGIWGGENFQTRIGQMILRMESDKDSDQRPVEVASRLLSHIQNDLAPLRPAPIPSSLAVLLHGAVQKALVALGSRKSGKASKALVPAEKLLASWCAQSGMETLPKSELAATIKSLAAKSR